MTLSELLIRFKIKYIIMAVNLIYCTVAIIARFFTSIITDLNLFLVVRLCTADKSISSGKYHMYNIFDNDDVF